jgi:hypothetical protein
MLDHVFLSVSDIERSIAFYAQALAPLGITDRVDYDGKDGPPGHPDLKGFGSKGRFIFWLQLGVVDRRAAHVGFSQSRGAKSMQPTPPRWRRVRPTMANQVFGSTTIRVTMPATCSTLTATASNLFSRAGSTPSPSHATEPRSPQSTETLPRCRPMAQVARPQASTRSCHRAATACAVVRPASAGEPADLQPWRAVFRAVPQLGGPLPRLSAAQVVP